MSKKAVVGIYDSLAKAENAEFRLEEAHLPVGQISLIAPRMEDGKIEGDITARGVAEKVADTGIRMEKDQVAGYEKALKEAKFLLIFHGDDGQAGRAYQALENTDTDGLAVMGG